MIERFLTTEQVANILQVHPFTILKFIRNGKLKGVKLGRVYRIKESDVHEFLESRITMDEAKSGSGVDNKAYKPKAKKQTKVEENKPTKPNESEPKDKHFKLDKDDKDKGEGEHYYII